MTENIQQIRDTESQSGVSQRITFLINHYEDGNKSSFGRRTEMKSGVVGDLVGGRFNKPSFDATVKILSAYPSVNAEWFLKGEGPIFKSTEKSREDELPQIPYLARYIDYQKSSEGFDYSRVIERRTPEENIFSRLADISEATYLVRYDYQQVKELIKEAYELITPEIFKLAATGRNAHMYILYWDFLPNASVAWSVIRTIPIGLYPQYPALNYLLDFADPYRRIAVFIEEKANVWTASNVDYQDKLLALYGWKVFRVPMSVAKTYESDLLPEHLLDVYEIGPESKEQWQERKSWDASVSKQSIDGFFRWLKDTYFKEETITSMAYRKRDFASWEEESDKDNVE